MINLLNLIGIASISLFLRVLAIYLIEKLPLSRMITICFIGSCVTSFGGLLYLVHLFR